jgi:hypothetical protein
MDGQVVHMPRLAIAIAVMALFAAVLVPAAGATSPSQDQYGSAIPGVGGNGGSGNSSSTNPSGSAESTIPVAPSSGSSSGTQSSSSSDSTASNGGGTAAHEGANGGQAAHASTAAGNGSNDGGTPVNATNANQSVPHIAADSAGDGWVPFFIAGLLALGAAGGFLVYRNRRGAAQS